MPWVLILLVIALVLFGAEAWLRKSLVAAGLAAWVLAVLISKV